MSRFQSALILFVLVSACACIPSHAQSLPAKQAAKTEMGADPALIDLGGYKKVLEKYRGKPLLVTFWATWCEPCRDEFPMVVELTKQYAPQGLSVFGVSLDDNADMHLVRRFLAQYRPTFPNYRQDPQIDVDEFYRGVNPSWQGTMPETIFYLRDGRIAQHFVGEQPRAAFEQAIRNILSGHLAFHPADIGTRRSGQ